MSEAQLITANTIVAALVGVVLGSGFEKLLRRAEGRPLFRIRLGFFANLEGAGFSVHVENIGLSSLPEYVLSLQHPGRGGFAMFPAGRESGFPQHPTQVNTFECVTRPRLERDKVKDWFDHYFLRVNGEDVSSPNFTDFDFRITLARSETVLFESKDLGNTLAKWIYQDYSGGAVEQPVKEVTYVSKAPFYVELLRRRRQSRYISKVMRGS